MSRIVIFGAGDIADVAAFYFAHDSAHQVVGFTVDGAYLRESSFCGLPVVAFEELEGTFPPDEYEAFAALSYSRLNQIRAGKCTALKSKGYRLCSYVSSKATVWPDVVMGEHCFVLEHNNIQPRVRMGDDVFLWSGNHIGHHAQIGDHVFFASQIAIGGRSIIGSYTFIGGQAGISQSVRIGERCIIGAASLITCDTEDGSVYAAKSTRKSPVPSSRVRKF